MVSQKDTQLPVGFNEGLVIVAVGASAGGLEAITQLLENSEPHGHFAFVIAQHMAPQYRSLLVELLAKKCNYKVIGATDGCQIVADTVYVNIPNNDITVKEGCIRLSKPAHDGGPKPSVDKLFESVAECYGARSIAVVLSGTGSDGTAGCRSVRDAGGVVITQDPTSAKYDGMPNSVVRAGLSHLMLSPEGIASYLSKGQDLSGATESVTSPKTLQVSSLDSLLGRIRSELDIDYSQYKMATLERQVQRRSSELGMETLADYFEFAGSHPEELKKLSTSFLVSVTEFFRDNTAFKALIPVLNDIIEQVSEKRAIRIWVPACATGEEVYSIAMLLSEQLGSAINDYSIKIFATDLNATSLEFARQGVYSSAAVSNIDPDMVDKYFNQVDDDFRIKKWVRDMCMFATHDLTKDPAFLRVDLVSCRNVLIYFDTALQEKIISSFHYSLKTNGYLFLGKSESITRESTNLFEAIDTTHRLYRRKSGVSSYGRFSSVASKTAEAVSNTKNMVNKSPAARMNEKIYAALIEDFAPPSVQLNEQLQPVQIFGDVSPFIAIGTGPANFDIVGLSKKEVRKELTSLFNEVIKGQRDSSQRSMTFTDVSGVAFNANVSVRRLVDPQFNQTSFILSYQRLVVDATAKPFNSTTLDKNLDGHSLESMYEELQRTREHLEAVVEELETSNEELQALNEELQASSEELQASNEELETTNEEMQATNEELTTVNDELQAKSVLLTDTNEALYNVQRSMDLPMIVVDKSLRVMRFTPQSARLFGILPDDIGERLITLPRHVEIHDLEEQVNSVLQNGVTNRCELTRGGDTFVLNITPYRRTGGELAGAVLTFVETSKLKESIDQATFNKEMLIKAGALVDQGLLMSTPGFGQILFASGRLEEWTMRKEEVLLSDSETFIDIIAPEDRERISLEFRKVDTQGWDLTYRFKRRDGSYIKVHDVANRTTISPDRPAIMTSVITLIE